MTRHKDAVPAGELARLPYLTARRAALLADCSVTTIRRSSLVPIGKRGRSLVYRTSDVLAWMIGAESHEPHRAREIAKVTLASGTAEALARLQLLKGGLR